MEELKCPHCQKLFQVDESGYQQIAKQVRDKEFEKDLENRKKEIEKNNENIREIEKVKQEQKQEELLKKKDSEIVKKEQMIEKLKNKLENNQTEQKLAISKVEQEKDQELLKKTQEILEKKNRELTLKNEELAKLKNKLEKKDTEQQLVLSKLEQEKNTELTQKLQEISELKSTIASKETEKQLSEKTLKESYELQLKIKEEELERVKDFKAKQSTKMVGESLEIFCSNEFNKIRMSAFPNAYFEKDNDVRSGSKGDFIFREERDGVEFISIMFEMKNECDTTATKHKNEDFFKELDKDRREKKCEYAILVSMLENENELYNTGIVDVSYKYEKMYVIRPQFFIQIITLLRNAALNSLKYRQELQVVKNQQVDLQNFEQSIIAFKDAFGRNYRLASEKFQTAIDEIDKTISHLQKTKEALLSSDRNLRLANDKANELSIKKLTTNAPSVRQMLEEMRE